MMAKRLAKTALVKPAMIPLVYCDSNLKMIRIPVMIKIPAIISSLDTRFLLISGSKIAVNKVIDERQTRLTETVDNLMERKNNIQWPPTSAPVVTSLKKVFRLTRKAVLLKLKYRNKETEAISTRYQTNGTAEMVISLPRIPVKPQMKTVK